VTLLDSALLSKVGNTIGHVPFQIGWIVHCIVNEHVEDFSSSTLAPVCVLLPPHNVHITFDFLVRILLKVLVASHV
jgi:hypothetical protein